MIRRRKFKWVWLFSLGWFVFCVCGIPPARSQDRPDKLDKEEALPIMEEVNVTATRVEKGAFDTPAAISVITQKDIRYRSSRTAPEALRDVVGVLVQKTAHGHGSPIIRGLTGKETLILVDGVRLNNSTFRTGPNQYMNTIDPAQIERIEVVRGPGSALYGSDALGGVINIITKKPQAPARPLSLGGELFGRYGGADQEKTGRLELTGNLGNLSLVAGGSFRDFSDLRGGRHTGEQHYTGYSEPDADLKLHYRLSPNQGLTMAYQHVKQQDVPRMDRFVNNQEKFMYNPQQRDLAYLEYALSRPLPLLDSLKANLSYQRQAEKTHRQRFNRLSRVTENEDVVDTWGATVQANSSIGERQLLTYGAEFYRDRVSSWRKDLDLKKGTVSRPPGNFPDDSRYFTLGAYLQDEIWLLDNLSATVGLRYSRFRVDSPLSAPFSHLHDIYRDLTGSLRLLYGLTDHVNLVLGLSEGFRAPNLDDTVVLSKVTNQGVDVPSTDLEPVQSLNYELGVKASYRRFAGSLFYYRSTYKDLIDRRPSSFRGLPFLDENGNGRQDRGEERVFQKFNVGKALIEGIEAEAELHLGESWALFGNFDWTYGRDRTHSAALSRIPPAKGMLGVRWSDPRRRYWAKYYNEFVRHQGRLSPRDKLDPRIDPTGTPGYATLNLHGGFQLGRHEVVLALENLTNKDYRVHGSGLNGPGTNFIVSYGLGF